MLNLFSKKESDDKISDDKIDKKSSQGVSPGMAERITGEDRHFVRHLNPYLPHELIGGAVPAIAGNEEEAVWNAAAQACATEKVHFTYTVEGGRCWYLACPSSSLTSNPDSWCPLAAALPGNSEFWDKETVYIYEYEGQAAALRWDTETGRMQVFIGAARTLLPRMQSMDANFATINSDVANQVPWKNRMLRTELLSRATAKVLFLSGFLVTIIVLLFLVSEFFVTANVERDLKKIKRETDQAAQKLTMQAYNALQSDTIKHMVRVQVLLDELKKLGGTLVKYEVNGKKVVWEALVPQAYTGSIGQTKTDVIPPLEKDGRARVRGYQ